MTDKCPNKSSSEKVSKNAIYINCKYEKVGCEFKVPMHRLEELKTHYREGMYTHLKICFQEYSKLEEKFGELKSIISPSQQQQQQQQLQQQRQQQSNSEFKSDKVYSVEKQSCKY